MLAKDGELKGAALKKGIIRARQLGLDDVAKSLEMYLVHPNVYAGDLAPEEVKKSVAEMLSVLKQSGIRLSRFEPMLKRKGIISTLESVACGSVLTKNFLMLKDLGRLDLTVESIVQSHPGLFSSRAVIAATRKLSLG